MSDGNAITLYVEKSSRTGRDVILDFVSEMDYFYLRYHGDYFGAMPLYHYEPTMILVKNVSIRYFHQGSIISIDREALLFYWREHSMRTDDTSAVIAFVIENGDRFVYFLLAYGASVLRRPKKEFYDTVDETWSGKPCALERLSDAFQVHVLDVGQGSANMICDASNITLFDFGASIFWSRAQYRDTLERLSERFDRADTISLMISHWDCDHYNLLTVADDAFLEKLHCVFVPWTMISLTAKNVCKFILSKCRYVTALKPTMHRRSRAIGMHPTRIRGEHYMLYMGESTRNINLSGSALCVYNNEQITILSADHSNTQIWDGLYKDMIARMPMSMPVKKVNVIVPHHGGKAGKLRLPSVPLAGKAVASVGKNAYKHPDPEVLDAYSSHGFDVLRTDWERNDIVIDMPVSATVSNTLCLYLDSGNPTAGRRR